MYSYNSYHKIITVAIIVAWAIFQFSGSSGSEHLYYPNGQIKVSGTQVNERNHGTWIWYFPDGSVQLKGDFADGDRIGIWKRYSETGHLIMVANYYQNRLDGLYTEYDTSGLIIRQIIYQSDTILKRLTENEFHEPLPDK